MAEHDHIDLTTLQEVERLLATTDFASADDLVARAGAIPSTRGRADAGRPLSAPPPGTELDLPRRR